MKTGSAGIALVINIQIWTGSTATQIRQSVGQHRPNSRRYQGSRRGARQNPPFSAGMKQVDTLAVLFKMMARIWLRTVCALSLYHHGTAVRVCVQ